MERGVGPKVGVLFVGFLGLSSLASAAGPSLVLPAEELPGPVLQLLFSDRHHLHVLCADPARLLRVDIRTGIVDLMATDGPGPRDLDGRADLLAREGAALWVHQPGRGRSLRFEADRWERTVEHRAPVVARWSSATGDRLLLPRPIVALGRGRARVELSLHAIGRESPGVEAPASALLEWSVEGTISRAATAGYLSRLLPVDARHAWIATLGPEPLLQLVDLEERRVDRRALGEGSVLVDAEVDDRRRLHLFTREGGNSGTTLHTCLGPDGQMRSRETLAAELGCVAIDPAATRLAAIERPRGDLIAIETTRVTPLRR